MVLDAVLADPDVVWLGAGARQGRALPRAARAFRTTDMPRLIFRGPKGSDRALLPGSASHRLPSGWSRASLPVSGARLGLRSSFDCSSNVTARCSVPWPSGGFDCSSPRISRGAEERHEVACWNEFATPLTPDDARRAALVFRASSRARRSLAGFRRGAVPASPREVLSATVSGALPAVERPR